MSAVNTFIKVELDVGYSFASMIRTFWFWQCTYVKNLTSNINSIFHTFRGMCLWPKRLRQFFPKRLPWHRSKHSQAHKYSKDWSHDTKRLQRDKKTRQEKYYLCGRRTIFFSNCPHPCLPVDLTSTLKAHFLNNNARIVFLRLWPTIKKFFYCYSWPLQLWLGKKFGVLRTCKEQCSDFKPSKPYRWGI